MAKFSIDRFPAGFFDITQSVARELPLPLSEQWTHSDRSRDTARRLLSAHAVPGAAVSTDAAGLTSMSRRRSVIEILALLDHPKEIIHGCGTALGGEALGVWAADNTAMLYRQTEPRRLLSGMLEARDRIQRACEVQVGFCLHTGPFYLLSDGLYGAAADRVERLAEGETQGGEVMVTDEFLRSLGDGHPFTAVERTDVHGIHRVWTITDGPRAPELRQGDIDYPYPYSREFFDDLRRMRPIDRDEARRLTARYAQTRTVVLAEHEREETNVPEIAVLNDLAVSAAMRNVAADLLPEMGGADVKAIGNVGIYTFDDTRAALTFARRLRELLKAQGIALRIGVDRGEVLVFTLRDGGEDIAGLPVNIASKIAQDRGEFGRLYLTDGVADLAGVSGLERLSFRIAGIEVSVLVE